MSEKLIGQLRSRIWNPDAVLSFISHSDATLMHEAADELTRLRTEVEELANRIEELESQAEVVSDEFEKDCWKALKALLTLTEYDWRDSDTDGVSAEDALEYIRDELNSLYDGQSKAIARAEKAEAAIRWALGEEGDFEPRGEGDPAYWWRKELRRLARGEGS